MFPRYQVIGLLVSLALVVGLLGACGPQPEPPVVSEVNVEPSTTTLVGESASLTIKASGIDLKFKWTASRGRLSSSTAPSVLYTAPDSPGPDTVTVEVTSKGGTTIRSVTFEVVELPTPTPTPTATLTQSPTPTPTETPSTTPTLTETPSPTPILTETPSPTPTSTKTPSLTPTPAPVPIVYCTDNGGGGTETILVEPPRTVVQIRIDMMKRATDFGYSLLEVEAYGPDTGNINLVAGGTATATTAQDDENCRECFADKVIDGDMTTRWASDWVDPQWLEIILPESQVVNRIVLKWETAYAKEYCVTTLPVYALNVKSGDIVSQTLMLRGGYTSQVTDDIWIMVGTAAGNTLWPQSPNACEGQPALKLDGWWEVHIGAGVPDDIGKLFEIVVTTTDDAASRLISQMLQTWCQQDYYPGIPRSELPDGLTEHQRITVRRGSGNGWLRSLDISNVELPGQVTLEGINSGDISPQRLTVGGVYADVTDHIWVLVYAPDGHYYPQSTNACAGISTSRHDDLWEGGISLGGDSDGGKPFDIIVVLANEDAHAIFEERQQKGCATGEYPGHLFIELPRGIDQKASVSVTRQ